MTPEQLLDEITNGPLALELADALASGDDVAICAALNSKDIPSQGWISVADFETWCASNDAEYKRIEALSRDETSPFYSAANSLLRRLSVQNTENAINTGAPPIASLLDAWPYVDANSKESLLALGRTLISRAEQLGEHISLKNVIDALYNEDGARRVL